jgi:hypothetical protein
MAHSTFFALVSLPKDQLVGIASKHKTTTSNHITRPKYETERDVTLAIINKELKFGTEAAYAAAREYQKELKKLNAPKFFKRSATTNSRNNQYMHTMYQKLG